MFSLSLYISYREHHRIVSMIWGRGISVKDEGYVGVLSYSCHVYSLDQFRSDPEGTITIMCVFHAVNSWVLQNPTILEVCIVNLFWGFAYSLNLP